MSSVNHAVIPDEGSSNMSIVTTLYEKIYMTVRAIPKGKVATYGQIGRAVGNRHFARQVGYALSALPANSSVPWHRVVNAKGQISQRKNNAREFDQQYRLIQEGIQFSLDGTIELSCFQHRFGADTSESKLLLDRLESNIS